jgi:hypothetical protein
MHGRMRDSDLRPELQTPEARRLLSALLDLQIGRLRVVDQFHRQRAPSATYLDAIILLHIFVRRHHGTRQQQLVESMGSPRRTIRDSLARMHEADMVCRDHRGLYFPTQSSAESANVIFGITLREIGRLCEAYQDFREVCPRAKISGVERL